MTSGLPDTATIQRSAAASDGAGGQTLTWNAVGTASCRLAEPRGALRDVANRLDAQGAWAITFPAATDVRVADRVVVNSKTYQVNFVTAPRSWETHRSALCVEV